MNIKLNNLQPSFVYTRHNCLKNKTQENTRIHDGDFTYINGTKRK